MRSIVGGVGFFALSLAGCGGADGGDPSREEVACVDTATAVAEAAVRCGQAYQPNYDAFVQAAAGGDCGNIIQVRDEMTLRDVCIPSLQTVACGDLAAGRIDDSCRDQLLR